MPVLLTRAGGAGVGTAGNDAGLGARVGAALAAHALREAAGVWARVGATQAPRPLGVAAAPLVCQAEDPRLFGDSYHWLPELVGPQSLHLRPVDRLEVGWGDVVAG